MSEAASEDGRGESSAERAERERRRMIDLVRAERGEPERRRLPKFPDPREDGTAAPSAD